MTTFYIKRDDREFKVTAYRGTSQVYYNGNYYTVADDETYTSISELHIKKTSWQENSPGDLCREYAPMTQTLVQRDWKPLFPEDLAALDPEITATLEDLRITAIEHYDAAL